MKKITLLAAVAIAVLSTSCKKDRVCTCKTDQAGSKDEVVTYIKSRKADARENCMSTKGDETTYSSTGGITTVTVTRTCTLK